MRSQVGKLAHLIETAHLHMSSPSLPDTHTHVCVSGAKKCQFFGNGTFGLLQGILRVILLSAYYLVFSAYFKAIWEWYLNISFNFLSTQFDHSWKGQLMQRSARSCSLSLVKYLGLWNLYLKTCILHQSVFICGCRYLHKILSNFQFFSNCSKICPIYFLVFIFVFKISSSLVPLIKLKRHFVFALLRLFTPSKVQCF